LGLGEANTKSVRIHYVSRLLIPEEITKLNSNLYVTLQLGDTVNV